MHNYDVLSCFYSGVGCGGLLSFDRSSGFHTFPMRLYSINIHCCGGCGFALATHVHVHAHVYTAACTCM